MSDGATTIEHLGTWERVGILAAALAVGALTVCLLVAPGRSLVIERDSKGVTQRSTESPVDRSGAILLFGGAAVFLAFVGLNGLRLTAFAFGPVSGESKSSEVKAAEAYASGDQRVVEVDVPAGDLHEEEPAPAAAPQGSVIISGEAEAVYPVAAVPTRILNAVLGNWPFGDIARPNDLSTFEFAIRKTGRGNHPWIVKFRDAPAIRVSYGGKRKSGATVAADE